MYLNLAFEKLRNITIYGQISNGRVVASNPYVKCAHGRKKFITSL
jgi:hypothetical protein